MVSGRMPKNREARAEEVPMIGYVKRERRESLGKKAGEMSVWVTKGDRWCWKLLYKREIKKREKSNRKKDKEVEIMGNIPSYVSNKEQ